MFWILRRTGAVNFFNSINNNYSAKSHSESVYNDSGKILPTLGVKKGTISTWQSSEETKKQINNRLLRPS